jgi:Glycosyltransferase (GlcNAc)
MECRFPCRYDIFTPIENLIFHHYEREKGKIVYSDHDELWWSEEQRTLVKVRFMLGLSHQPPNETLAASMQTHGMGDARTLQQYYQFAAMDPARNVSHAAAKFCGPGNGMPPTACLKQISQPITEPIEQYATITEAEAAALNRTAESRRQRSLLRQHP